jgi:hypothetical protein
MYQVSKQIKLKMLKGYEHSTNTVDNSKQATVVGGEGQEKGLFGYFNNINKAIDKIKTSTSSVIGVNEKVVKEEEEKKSEIVYDPVRKRYMINGTIPEE